jgi:hypothetical protein
MDPDAGSSIGIATPFNDVARLMMLSRERSSP